MIDAVGDFRRFSMRQFVRVFKQSAFMLQNRIVTNQRISPRAKLLKRLANCAQFIFQFPDKHRRAHYLVFKMTKFLKTR